MGRKQKKYFVECSISTGGGQVAAFFSAILSYPDEKFLNLDIFSLNPDYSAEKQEKISLQISWKQNTQI